MSKKPQFKIVSFNKAQIKNKWKINNEKFLDNFCQELIAFANYLSKVFINI